MIRTLRIGTLLTFALLAVAAAALAAQKPEELAEQAADSWLALNDQKKYAESYEGTAQYFKNAVTKEQWEASSHAARDPLGKVLSRKLKSATYTKTLPAAPDGEYVVLQYETSFEHKQSAIETVTPMLDAGTWRVSGYYIR